ncbi:MAG: hypothetical protein ACON3Z_18075 [Bradymonadia bacterium]
MYPFFIAGALLASEPDFTQVAHSVTSAGDGHISGSLQVDARRRSIEGARGIARRCKIELGLYLWSSSTSVVKHDTQVRGALIGLSWCRANQRRGKR